MSFLRDIDVPYVLVMTVEPGFASQKRAPASDDRVRRARSLVGDDVVIGVDGNVSLEHAQRAKDLGATLFVCGTSSLFTGDEDYASAVESIRRRVDPEHFNGRRTHSEP
jgi:ribulose-phosphate 3-epimerase